MLAINIGILIVLTIGYLYSITNTREWVKNIDKKEHPLYGLYPLSDWVLTKTGLEKALNQKDHTRDVIKALHVTSKPEMLQKLFWCNKISIIIVILTLFNLLSLMVQLQSVSNSVVLEDKYLERPNYGEGSDEVELNVTLEHRGEKEAVDNESVHLSQDLKIRVKERSYSEEELANIMEESIHYLEITVLGSNESTELICENLKFSKNIPGTSITVEWKSEDYNIIKSDGTVNNEEISVEGVTTTVTAILTYREEKMEHTMSFHIMPRQYSEEEALRKKLEDEIMAASEKGGDEKLLELPDTLENYHLRWKGKDENTGVGIFFLGIFLAIVAWFYSDKELDNQMTKRKEQLLLDYPEIINKFTLLVNAGMTVKQAWIKIVDDYSAKYAQKRSKKRYAYEEMRTTAHELKLGLPESIAYEQYGRRIGLIPYIKFSSLIVQNLKKGNKGFLELMTKEAIEAFEDRKETAKRLGEEAGTKLLAPMMIMLVIVFLVILIPAFRSFGT